MEGLLKSCSSLPQVARVESIIFSKQKQPYNTLLLNTLIQKYGLLGSAEDARRIFDRMEPSARNSYSWLALLSAYARNRQPQAAKRVIDSMPNPNVVAFCIALSLAVRCDSLDEAVRIFRSMPGWDVTAWNTMLAAYAASGHLQQAQALFDSMPVHDVISYTTLLSGYARAGFVESTCRIFDQMPERNLVSWNSMLAALARTGRLDDVKSLVAGSMPEKDLRSNNSLLLAFVNADRMEEAETFYSHVMPEHDLVSSTTLLLAYAKNGRMDEADSIFYSLPVHDLVCSNTMLFVYSQRGQCTEARRIFDQMPVHSLCSWNPLLFSYANQEGCLHEVWNMLMNQMQDADEVSWTSLISALLRNRMLDRAKNLLLHEIPLTDVICWNAVMAADHDHAVQLFELMLMEGLQPSSSSYISLLLSCNHRGVVRDAINCFRSMILDHTMNPTEQHYSCMIDLLGRAGHRRDAEELIDNMPFVPDSVDWKSFFNASTSTAAATRLLELQPDDPSSYVMLSSMI